MSIRKKIEKILGYWPKWATEDNQILRHPLFNKKNEHEAESWYQHVKVEKQDPDTFDYDDYMPYDNDNLHYFN